MDEAVEEYERVSSDPSAKASGRRAEAAPSPKRYGRVGDLAKEDMLPAFVALMAPSAE
jgi:hypothetical protein